MNIERITVRNFRNVGDLSKTFVLNPHFTAIIGINGKGKSTILNSLRVVCGVFFLGIPDVLKKGSIKQDEVRLKDGGKQLIPQTPVIVEAEGWFTPDKKTI